MISKINNIIQGCISNNNKKTISTLYLYYIPKSTLQFHTSITIIIPSEKKSSCPIFTINLIVVQKISEKLIKQLPCITNLVQTAKT